MNTPKTATLAIRTYETGDGWREDHTLLPTTIDEVVAEALLEGQTVRRLDAGRLPTYLISSVSDEGELTTEPTTYHQISRGAFERQRIVAAYDGLLDELRKQRMMTLADPRRQRGHYMSSDIRHHATGSLIGRHHWDLSN